MVVMGGVFIVVFGFIVIVGVKIWVDNKVDFFDNCNLMVVVIIFVLGIGEYMLKFVGLMFGGIGIVIFGVIIFWVILGKVKLVK